jgi:hypothetical protein
MKYLKTFFTVLCTLCIFGCDNNKDGMGDDNSTKTYPVQMRASSYEVPVGCTDNKMESDSLYIINAQEELAAWVPCASGISDIDWKQQTLLATWDRRCNVDSKVIEQTFEEVAGNIFRFQVTIEPSATANAAPLIIYTIVPKLPENAIVGFNITIPNDGNNGGNMPTDSLVNNSSAENTLVNIKWKLSRFVYAIGAKTKEPEPKGETCYTIYFDSDNKRLSSFSSVNELFGDYELDYKSLTLKIKQLGGTKINEQYDGKLFVDNLQSVHSFTVNDRELRLYYNEFGDYLLFTKM